ncbi:MAG TPA: FG-GAP-like repeat-containing protein, partial [Gemmataceae bacterium]|nr:FG-GAP-like repeat-containing protein [Gemmataceae bacterium]
MRTAAPALHRDRRWVALLLVLLVAGGAAAYFAFVQKKKPAHDMAAATAANLRGVGYMERHEMAKAEEAFGEAVKFAPDWLPFQINYGIALFNQQPADTKELSEQVTRARRVFTGVLDKDANNKHARYCLGMIALYVGELAPAHEHFAAVNKLDPDDAHTWLRFGSTHPDGPNSPRAMECYEKALKLDPYLNEARYKLAMASRGVDDNRVQKLLDDHKALQAADRFTESRIVYGEMGKYGNVIGRDPAAKPPVGAVPMFEPHGRVVLAAGAKWATAADLHPQQRMARERFGGTVVVFDYNRDGKPDVFLAHAVVETGKVRDLLLRNDGDNSFTDVTTAARLAAPRATLGAAAADYDNDGHADLVVTGSDGVRLFRNKGDGTFEDVTAAAGLDVVTDVCLGCGWVDIDQDGDLDLVICKYAPNPSAAAAFAPKGPGGPGAVLFENVGVPPPVPPGAPPPGLSTKFAAKPVAMSHAAATTAFLAADLDADHDTDLLVFADNEQPVFVDNDRLMRLKLTTLPWKADKPGRWNGGLVLDANHDERSDVFLVSADGPPTFLVSKGSRDFTPGSTNSPRLRQAVAADIDMDGWCDVVGVTTDGKAVLLQNQGDGRLDLKATAFGELANVFAVGIADFDGDGTPDLLTWGDGGVEVRRNKGNGNHAVFVSATGKRDKGSNLRTSNDGVGAWIVAQAGPHWTGGERTTTTAGLGQSMIPTMLGMGKAGQADVLRVRWPDNVVQAELGVAAGPYKLEETNRKGTSCPILMTWDGEKFVFVTDFLGGGALGESGPDGSVRPPRPEESVKIEPHQLVPKNGQYVLKIAEPMDEVLYLDRVQLLAVDHPAGVSVFPDERFVFGAPLPTQELLAFKERVFPKTARDHRDRDVTKLVLERDRRAADTFHVRSWLGYAEDHTLTLDFGDIPDGKKRWHLVLAGWTEYPYPESMYAATRAGITIQPPVLERLAADGKTWQALCDLGFPAGLPRVMTRELASLAPGKCVLR